MKKTFFTSVLILAAIIFSPFVSASAATDDNVKAETVVTTSDLGLENPGILPTSPFYFLKEIQRKIQTFLTVNPVSKAELSLKFANERAAEIKKLEEVAPQKISAISKAVNNYRDDVERLQKTISSLAGTSENKNINDLLDKLVDRALTHEQLFEELKARFGDDKDLGAKIQTGQSAMQEVVAQIPQRFEDAEAFKNRIEKGLENQPIKKLNELQSLRAIEILNQIKSKLPEASQAKIDEVKSDLIKKFETEISKLKTQDLENLLNTVNVESIPGGSTNRIETLEEIKSLINLDAIRAKISAAKDKVINEQIESKKVTDKEVENLISEVRVYIENSAKEIGENGITVFEKASAALSNAEKAFKDGKIGEAFGQITSAKVLAQNIYKNWLKFKTDLNSSFCGKSTYGECSSDTDCVAGGCSGQICSAKNDEGTMTTCEWRDCYKKPENAKCGCAENKCQWANAPVIDQIPCPLFSISAAFVKECEDKGGYMKSTKMENGCIGPGKCVVPDEEICAINDSKTRLSLSEAKKIYEASDCAQTGNFNGEFSCNEGTGTWWLGIDATKSGCSPACVIHVGKRTAEINWRCTGLIIPQ